MVSPRYIVWDWHGVLGTKGFWYHAAGVNPDVRKFVQYAFDAKRINSWMRGELTFEAIVAQSGATSSPGQLRGLLAQDLQRGGAVNVALQSVIAQIYPMARHVLVTDNMDIFSEYAHESEYLKHTFTYIFNSSDVGRMKADTAGLFEYALQGLGLESYDGCLLLDDSPASCQRFEILGGKSICVKGEIS